MIGGRAGHGNQGMLLSTSAVHPSIKATLLGVALTSSWVHQSHCVHDNRKQDEKSDPPHEPVLVHLMQRLLKEVDSSITATGNQNGQFT